MKKILYDKVYQPVLSLLKQGMSPSLLSWSLASGAIIGLFPIIGLSSTMCFGIALIFRLNQIAIQVANYAVYPIQLLLIIPYIRIGEKIGGYPSIELSPSQLINTFESDFWLGLSTYGERVGLAVVAWLLTSVPLLIGLRLVFQFILTRVRIP